MTLTKPIWMRAALSEGELEPLERLSAGHKPGARLRLDGTTRRSLAPVDRVIAHVNASAKPVRLVAFDKTRTANWAVPWHQDRVIAVAERHEIPGFRNWSCKDGLWHCEPPIDVLQEMLFFRVYLDDADNDGGPMEIAIGSHAAGLVKCDEAEEQSMLYQHHTCKARRGDVQILPMLTLHRSGVASRPVARRVLRLDYATSPLPHPLVWAN